MKASEYKLCPTCYALGAGRFGCIAKPDGSGNAAVCSTAAVRIAGRVLFTRPVKDAEGVHHMQTKQGPSTFVCALESPQVEGPTLGSREVF